MGYKFKIRNWIQMGFYLLTYELGIGLSTFQSNDITRIINTEKETATLSIRKGGDTFQPTLCFLFLYRFFEIVGRAFHVQYFVECHIHKCQCLVQRYVFILFLPILFLRGKACLRIKKRARHRCPAPEIIYKLYSTYIAYLIMKSAARIHIVMEIFLNLPVNALRTT